ncbi:hypothetical protein PR048_028905 [Dryococelus australis]|uniref:Uncharacterized protein n=1 Tax=Dryococelus australis TaxID=614101 RepID=A0ABQ9GFM9_9NEOP|nr:hypothetical protein PR048_028905 [Dryococelus australis]
MRHRAPGVSAVPSQDSGSQGVQGLLLGRDYMYVEPGDSCFCIRAINSSHSAFGVFTFPQSFFVKYWVETEADPAFNIKLLHCRLSVKKLLKMNFILGNTSRSMFKIFLATREGETICFEILVMIVPVLFGRTCSKATAKVQFLPVIAWETMELQIGQTPDMSNHFTATAKQFTDVLVNFYPNPNDITIIVTAQNLWLQNFIDGARDPKKARRTEMILHAGEFHDYHVDQKSQVTFNVKDWKAILSFAGAFTLPVAVNFQKAGRPVVFRAQREGLFEAKYILSTVSPCGCFSSQSVGVTSVQSSRCTLCLFNFSSHTVKNVPRSSESCPAKVGNNSLRSGLVKPCGTYITTGGGVGFPSGVIGGVISAQFHLTALVTVYNTVASTSEKISTVFKCCFREPFDVTELPGYDEILAEDSDGESWKDVIDLAVTFGLGDKEFDNFDKLIEAFHNHVSSNQNETNKREALLCIDGPKLEQAIWYCHSAERS